MSRSYEPSITPQVQLQDMIATFRRELDSAVIKARTTGLVTWVKESTGHAPVAAIVPVAVAESGMPGGDGAYQDPSELVIRVQGRLSEPEEVALALEKLANRIRESGDIRSATGYDVAGGFRDTQGNAMGTTEVR